LTPFSKFLTRGLNSATERAAFAALFVLAGLYLGALGFFEIEDIPIDKSFMAQRDNIRIAHALADPLPLDQLVGVSDGHVTSPHVAILGGWSVPEAGGIWSIERSARIAIAFPHTTSSTTTLCLILHVALDRHGEQTLRLYGNGALLGSWTFTTSIATLQVPLPPPSGAPVDVLKLEFAIGTPVKPSASTDPRTLGIQLNGVEVKATK
jgi:hypothetical protein